MEEKNSDMNYWIIKKNNWNVNDFEFNEDLSGKDRSNKKWGNSEMVGNRIWWEIYGWRICREDMGKDRRKLREKDDDDKRKNRNGKMSLEIGGDEDFSRNWRRLLVRIDDNSRKKEEKRKKRMGDRRNLGRNNGGNNGGKYGREDDWRWNEEDDRN